MSFIKQFFCIDLYENKIGSINYIANYNIYIAYFLNTEFVLLHKISAKK